MIEWINDRYETNFSEGKLENVKNYSLLWNIFESKVCRDYESFSCKNIESYFSNINFYDEDINNIYNYFRNRYIVANDAKIRFYALKLRKNDREDFLVNIMSDENSDTFNKAVAIAIIVYRYRCNLFHGIKNFRLFNEQEENFSYANSFLMMVLEKLPTT